MAYSIKKPGELLFALLLVTTLACQKEEKPVPDLNYDGKYVGTIEGNFLPKEFPQAAPQRFSEPAEFIVTDNGLDGLIAGFDSVPAKLVFEETDRSIFTINEVRSTGEVRLGASGNFSGDTLKLGGTYTFIDKSRRQYQFIGVRK